MDKIVYKIMNGLHQEVGEMHIPFRDQEIQDLHEIIERQSAKIKKLEAKLESLKELLK